MSIQQSCATCRHLFKHDPSHERGYCTCPIPTWAIHDDMQPSVMHDTEGTDCMAYQPKELKL